MEKIRNSLFAIKAKIKQTVKKTPFVKLAAYYCVVIYGGFRIYKTLKKKYGRDTTIILCPYTGTGDIYNIGLYFEEFLKDKGIQEYTFVFRGKSEQQIGGLFGIHGESILNDREIFRLTRFAQMVHLQNVDVIQLHHVSPPEQCFCNLVCFEEYKGLTFNIMFREVTMELPKHTVPVNPAFETDPALTAVFDDLGLTPGNTVILSPYSASAQVIPMEVWTSIAEKLKKMGYSVATNCVVGKESPVPGTSPLSFPYKYAKCYVDFAGYFIGTRSGLCDIISTCNCKKIILSPWWAPGLAWGGGGGKTQAFYGITANYNSLYTAEVEYKLEAIPQIPDVIQNIVESQKFSGPVVRVYG